MASEEFRIGPGVALRLDRSGTGGGRAVLYLHGLGSAQDGEKAEYMRGGFLAAGRSFSSIDFRGHGLSGGSNLGLTLSRNLDDARVAVEHLETLGFSEIDLVGSSFGGLTALWFGRRHPGRIRRVAVIAPAVGIREKIRSILGESLLERWERDGNLPYVNELGTTVVGYGFFEDLDRYPESELADGYCVPTLVLQGELDESVDPGAVRRFAETVPSVALHTWSDGDHRLADRLEEVWHRISAFLESASP